MDPHHFDADAAQHDGPPLMGLYPFWQFRAGEQLEDIHPIDLTGLPRDRTYGLALGLYDPGGGQRLTPTTASGEQPADKAVHIGTVTLGQSPVECP